MRIKIVNFPNFSGYVWAEVVAGVSFLTGVGFSIYPF